MLSSRRAPTARTQRACLVCHAEIVHQMLPEDPGGEMVACVHCHADVGHAHR